MRFLKFHDPQWSHEIKITEIKISAICEDLKIAIPNQLYGIHVYNTHYMTIILSL